MALSDTLLVRHLPVCFFKTDIEDFLKHMGATKVVVFDSKVKKQIAFATFKNHNIANEVLFRLHQKEIFGSRLVVEYAKTNELYSAEKNRVNETEKKDDGLKAKLYETFFQNLNNWATGLNFTLPPPHHLRYCYPRPSAEALLNIVNALSCTTKFYTQVLHLMNKMNLPSPFEPSFPRQDNEIFNAFIIYILENSTYEGKENEESHHSSTDAESELESEEDVKKRVLPQKRSLPKKKNVKRKLLKPFPSVVLKNSKVSSVEEVFDMVEREALVKKIQVRIPTKITVAEKNVQVAELTRETNDGFGVMYPADKPKEKKLEDENEDDTEEKCITAEELAMNRVSERDRKELPVFKNYLAGVPSRRLYIKNLAKDVELSDLQYIFRRYYVKGIDEQGTMFDIRLMQEGRMKGQAFVALQNEKLAEKALKETNGYIIKTKPMVVQFARSEIAK